jgi:hypothetical protein
MVLGTIKAAMIAKTVVALTKEIGKAKNKTNDS